MPKTHSALLVEPAVSLNHCSHDRHTVNLGVVALQVKKGNKTFTGEELNFDPVRVGVVLVARIKTQKLLQVRSGSARSAVRTSLSERYSMPTSFCNDRINTFFEIGSRCGRPSPIHSVLRLVRRFLA